MKQNTVWTFTNQKSLNKKEFIEHIEKKVFKTIRKYAMLPQDKVFTIKKSNDLSTQVLTKILQTKFQVQNSLKPNTSSDNLSQVAEDAFKHLMSGEFKGTSPEDMPNKPLYFISDTELELYAKLTEVKGTKRKKNQKIQKLFDKFLSKNQDLEINIAKVIAQVKNSSQ